MAPFDLEVDGVRIGAAHAQLCAIEAALRVAEAAAQQHREDRAVVAAAARAGSEAVERLYDAVRVAAAQPPPPPSPTFISPPEAPPPLPRRGSDDEADAGGTTTGESGYASDGEPAPVAKLEAPEQPRRRRGRPPKEDALRKKATDMRVDTLLAAGDGKEWGQVVAVCRDAVKEAGGRRSAARDDWQDDRNLVVAQVRFVLLLPAVEGGGGGAGPQTREVLDVAVPVAHGTRAVATCYDAWAHGDVVAAYSKKGRVFVNPVHEGVLAARAGVVAGDVRKLDRQLKHSEQALMDALDEAEVRGAAVARLLRAVWPADGLAEELEFVASRGAAGLSEVDALIQHAPEAALSTFFKTCSYSASRRLQLQRVIARLKRAEVVAVVLDAHSTRPVCSYCKASLERWMEGRPEGAAQSQRPWFIEALRAELRGAYGMDTTATRFVARVGYTPDGACAEGDGEEAGEVLDLRALPALATRLAFRKMAAAPGGGAAAAAGLLQHTAFVSGCKDSAEVFQKIAARNRAVSTA
eukprot:TRINITY_DN2476_c0_g2_i1.p1 TRINITY_DN2476_c0_g2~~TRINITY_DN2476_c0_g2_i1.p1  ORF type:complete len:523 (+),score=160.47 TRINITY_DN2476_c0_g2_i1:51-1619(+)